MKIYIDWIGEHYINKRVEVEDSKVEAICGWDAMGILFDQCLHYDLDSDKYIVIFYRKDLGDMLPQTAHASFAVDCFASHNFAWAKIDREYLEKLIGE